MRLPEYSTFWGPPTIVPGGQRYAVGASSYLDGAASSIRPNGVADDPVHDRVVVDGGAGPQASSRLEALRAEHRQARGA